MTYRELLDLTAGFLTGDNKLPNSDSICLALLEDAFIEVADRASALHLMTLSADANILRLGLGENYLRFPNLPEDLDDDLDIDHELCGAVSRFIASYVSKDQESKHIKAAERRILNYNGKVNEILEKMKEDEAASTTCEA